MRDRSFGSLSMDWPLPDGRFVRVEVIPVFCANCGTPYGYVPRDNTSWAFWLCTPCFETYGAVAGTLAMPDEEFNRKVEAEMVERFGRVLTPDEIACVVARGQLGRPLELLTKESPYPTR